MSFITEFIINLNYMHKILFFIPTYNDQILLSSLIHNLLTLYPLSEVLVIDDGSLPEINLSKELNVHSKRLKLFRLPVNEGLGFSTSIAFDYMINNEFQYLVRIDSDGQHPHDNINILLENLINLSFDVVWGERINHYNNNSLKNIFASFTKVFTNYLGKIIFNSKIEDWYTGHFAINRVAANLTKNLQLERFCEVQLLCIFFKANLRIKSHKIYQFERLHGISSIGWLVGLKIFLRSLLIMILYALNMEPK
jgi:hypothetical protein